MTTQDTATGAPFDVTLFVERKLFSWDESQSVGLDDFVRWATGSDDHEIRVRLIVGAPGNGKSWFLQRLYMNLRDTDLYVHWLDLTSLLVNQKDDGFDLDKELHERIDTLQEFGQESKSLLRAAGLEHDRTVPAGFLFAEAIDRLERPSILLVDGYDDLSGWHRTYLEERFLAPLMDRAMAWPARLVIALRDPLGVLRTTIRQEMQVFTLQPLPASDDGEAAANPVPIGTAIDQINRRCEQLKTANEARRAATDTERTEALKTHHTAVERILEPPDGEFTPENLARLADLPADDIDRLQAGLRDQLTGTPLINNLLLWYTLLDGGELSAEHEDALWTHYLKRTKLKDAPTDPATIVPLLKRIHEQLEPEWTETEISAKLGYTALEKAEPLFAQGLLYTSSNGNTYGIHPDIVRLLNRTQGKPPEGT